VRQASQPSALFVLRSIGVLALASVAPEVRPITGVSAPRFPGDRNRKEGRWGTRDKGHKKNKGVTK